MKFANAFLRKIHLVVMTLGLALAFTTTIQAQELSEEHLKAARATMKATGATERLDNILPEVANFVKAGLIANRPDIEAEINNIVNETAISLAPRRGPLEIEVANIYGNRFTLEELQAIESFFSSDTGIKFLNQTPLLFRDVDRVSKVWREGIARDMGQAVQEKLKEAGLQ